MQGMKTIRFPLKKTPPIDQKKEEAKQQIDKLVQNSSEIICRYKTVFPFDFFPDQIVVTRDKVDIIYGVFFLSKEVLSILIPNIYEITIDFSLLFATLTFRVIGFQDDPLPVTFLKKNEAIILRRIITGMVIAHKENIDLKHFDVKELRQKLEQIGNARQE